jgi:hypothetical protein
VESDYLYNQRYPILVGDHVVAAPSSLADMLFLFRPDTRVRARPRQVLPANQPNLLCEKKQIDEAPNTIHSRCYIYFGMYKYPYPPGAARAKLE